MKKMLVSLLALICLGLVPAAAAKEDDLVGAGAPGGVAMQGSAFRYVALSPNRPHPVTVVERIEAPSGKVRRWWNLRGGWMIPAGSYHATGTGLSADESTLVLSAYSNGRYRFRRGHAHPEPPRVTRLAVLNTRVYLRHPEQPGSSRPEHAVKRITLGGRFEVDSVSPNGSFVYLRRRLPGDGIRGPHPEGRFRMAVLDVASSHLLPAALGPASAAPWPGVPIARVLSEDRTWAYTLFYGGGYPFHRAAGTAFIGALDTAARRMLWVPLPRVHPGQQPFGLRLRTAGGGSRLVVFHTDSGSPSGFTQPLASIDLPIGGAGRTARGETHPRHRFLDFLETPVGPNNLMGREGAAGRSAEGRPIRVRQWGDPTRRTVLVFGCIHGDECAARYLEPRFVLSSGCPDPDANLVFVPDLDPDGSAADTRLNGDGVDLNRNFDAGWRPLGAPGDLEYSGPRPFSEPESRLAARIVRQLDPAVTIWFHQHLGPRPFVRAWGQSAPAGRRFARLAHVPFRLMRWPDGTAPNWQNHRFPGTASFVVELPAGPLAAGLASRLGAAEALLAHRVGEDGHAGAKG